MRPFGPTPAARIARTLGGAALAALIAAPAMAAGWTTVDDQSSVAFGSIKSDTVGEVHHFERVKGTVAEDGKLMLDIDLASAQTNIDIRNERIAKLLFQEGKATARLVGEIDMDEVSALGVGETALVDIEGVLAFGGLDADIEATMLVARLAEDRVLVTTADFIMLETADLGIDAGVDQLMELAGLPGITRVTPIAARLVFEK